MHGTLLVTSWVVQNVVKVIDWPEMEVSPMTTLFELIPANLYHSSNHEFHRDRSCS